MCNWHGEAAEDSQWQLGLKGKKETVGRRKLGFWEKDDGLGLVFGS